MLPEDLAAAMFDLQTQGCSTIEPVSPSHHLPGLLEALALAAEQGLHLPVVYNSNGYESPEVIELLDGVVDVYLPDIKYADAHASKRFSDVADYVEVARSAVLQMHAQVGDLVVNSEGIASRGIIIRLLVLPDDIARTEETLLWIQEHLPVTTSLSLMAQYTPLHRGREFPPLDRPITQEEYDRMVDFAWDLGFDQVFIQEMESRNIGVPDFQVDKPFIW
jgi:putative pyruvate formate lyase activating enzyme